MDLGFTAEWKGFYTGAQVPAIPLNEHCKGKKENCNKKNLKKKTGLQGARLQKLDMKGGFEKKLSVKK